MKVAEEVQSLPRIDRNSNKEGVASRLSATRGRKTKPIQTPAALSAHKTWSLYSEDMLPEAISFDMQSFFLDEMMTSRINGYVTSIRQKLSNKLQANLLEPTEMNLFLLLVSSGLVKVLEYTNESMIQQGFSSVSPSEFRRFLGTLLLSTTFTLTIDHMFSLMDQLTSGAAMNKDRFREILHNLKGYDCRNRAGGSSTWDDQRNLLISII
jgi:hypothetical protein